MIAKRTTLLRKPARCGVAAISRAVAARPPDRVALLRRRRSALIIIACTLVAVVVLHLRPRALPPAPPPRPAQPASARRLDSRMGVAEGSTPLAAVGAPGSAPSAAVPPLGHIHARLRQFLARETGDEVTAEEILAELAALLTDDNAAAILRSLSGPELQTDFGTLALTRWARQDPRAAGDWIASGRAFTNQQWWQLGQHLAASTGPLDTLVATLPNGPSRQCLLNGAALALADTDPRHAVALADRMRTGEIQTGTFETIANAWITSDPIAAQTWMAGITNPELRERLLVIGAKALASTDPDLAATWIAGALRSPFSVTGAVVPVVDAWSERDPAAAAGWIASLPPQAGRFAAVETVFRHWSNSDPVAAGTWLSGLPERTEILARQAAAAAEAAEPKLP